MIDVIDSDDVHELENDISFSDDRCEYLKTDESAEHVIENQEDICTKLNELFQKCSTSGNKIRLKVRRSCLWEDTLAKMKRVTPDCFMRRHKWFALEVIFTLGFAGLGSLGCDNNIKYGTDRLPVAVNTFYLASGYHLNGHVLYYPPLLSSVSYFKCSLG